MYGMGMIALLPYTTRVMKDWISRLELAGAALPSLDGVRQNDVRLEPLSYAFVRFEAGQAGGWPAEPDEFKEGYRWRNDF